MGRKYKQLSQNDRISMETLLNKGHSVQEVADYLHVHRSTIYREMKRGEYVHRNSDYTENSEAEWHIRGLDRTFY